MRVDASTTLAELIHAERTHTRMYMHALGARWCCRVNELKRTRGKRTDASNSECWPTRVGNGNVERAVVGGRAMASKRSEFDAGNKQTPTDEAS